MDGYCNLASVNIGFTFAGTEFSSLVLFIFKKEKEWPKMASCSCYRFGDKICFVWYLFNNKTTSNTHFRFSRCNRALHKRCNGKKYFTYRSQTQQLSQFQFSFSYRFSWSTLRYKIFVPKVAHCIKSKFTSVACLYITPYSQGNRGVSKHDGNEDARKHWSYWLNEEK